jgi:hypothetical protein
MGQRARTLVHSLGGCRPCRPHRRTSDENLHDQRWTALERLRALLPLDGGSLDERFAALKPPGPREPGAPVHPDDFKWLTAAAFGVLIGWHFTAPSGID